MADLESDYWNSMDKAKELRIDPHQIGISHGIGEVGEGLKANIFRGASLVELGFFGQGKGFRSQPTGHTPESYGKTEREEMRQLAKINEVEVSTHISPNLVQLGGFDERMNAFRPEGAEFAKNEIKRGVEFAADVAEGGAVVVHVGEFPREVFKADEQFRHYKGEEERAPIGLVDIRTGAVQRIPRDATYTRPVKDKNGEPIKYRDGDKKGELMMEEVSVYKLQEEAKKLNKDPAEYIVETMTERDRELTDFEARRYRHMADQAEGAYNDLKNKLEKLEKFQDKALAKYNLIKIFEEQRLIKPGTEAYEEFLKNPLGFAKEIIKKEGEEVQFLREAESSYSRQNFDIEKRRENLKTIEKFGVDRTADTISQTAMYAYDVEQKKGLEKPLFLAVENWTPESYGGHPQELKKIITESRKKFAEDLVEKKHLSRSHAEKIAEEHIKATLDIGHLNFWKKYFKGSDEEFKEWVDEQMIDLAKNGIIGNVHLSDNFGYFDEHLTPGEGNAPIQKFVERLKEHGYKGKFIGEVGGQKEGHYHEAWTGTLKALGSPIYRVDSMYRGWSDIEGSYFGRAPQSPYFLVGDIVPSKDWTLWSEVPLE